MGFNHECELMGIDGDQKRKKILVIGILWTGEPQLEKLLSSISLLKKYYRVTIKIVGFQKNLPAHLEVWKFFSVHASADFRIKLDADMMLQDQELLTNILEQLSENCFFIFKVKDYITGSLINGVNIFTKGYEINYSACDNVFPDRILGEKVELGYCGISHCENASSRQVAEFIGHRLRKAFNAKGLRLKYSYFKRVLLAVKNNIRTIFFWSGGVMPAVLSHQYKSSIRKTSALENSSLVLSNNVIESDTAKAIETKQYLIKILKKYGYSI